METKAERFFSEIKGKKIAFLGIARSNTQIAVNFAKKGAVVTACDKKDREALGKICDTLEENGVTLSLGAHYLDNLDYDIIFKTPVMRYDMPELLEARRRGAVVTSEMEVFFDLCPCKIFGVTGSDGKTTTTTLIAEMLRAEGKTVHLGGNIGMPLLPRIDDIKPDDFVVVELSNFQLITMHTSPDVAVVTNVQPNHLDFHKDLQEYINSKKNILLHQNAFGKAVLNLDNEVTRGFCALVNGRLGMFSRKQPVENGTYCEDGAIYMSEYGHITKVMDVGEILLLGDHNVENYLAAINAVWGYVSADSMRKVAREFGGVKHRMELVQVRGGVKWYNDSIGTSPTRTIAGLEAFRQKIILIAGGYDKHLAYEPMVPAVLDKVKYLILMGATGPKIYDAVTASKEYDPAKLPVVFADTMEDAVRIADEVSGEGDIVALSPASASFDLYVDFEARGEHFIDCVHSL